MKKYFSIFFLAFVVVVTAASAEWQVVKNKTLGTLPSPTFAIRDGDLLQYTCPQNNLSNRLWMTHTPHDFKNHFENKSLQNLIHSNSESRASAGVMKSITLSRTGQDGVVEEVQLDVVVFSETHYRLSVIDCPKRDRSLQQAMSGNEFVAGINGGYFHPDNRPLGLLMHRGKVIHVQEKARLLSGFMVSNGHELELLRVGEKMPSGALDVVQAGPFLVDAGVPVVGLEPTKIAWRSFLASDGHGNFAMGVISPVTLAAASNILLTAAPEIFPGGSLQRVLNLDGGSSTAFWAALQRCPFNNSEQGEIRPSLESLDFHEGKYHKETQHNNVNGQLQPDPFLLHEYVQVRNFLGLQVK